MTFDPIYRYVQIPDRENIDRFPICYDTNKRHDKTRQVETIDILYITFYPIYGYVQTRYDKTRQTRDMTDFLSISYT